MGYFDKSHNFRDPVHEFIKLFNLEREILNSHPFQRLRGIRQLGLTNLVYHGADHTRFGHSLGVMEVATKVFNIVVQKDKDGDQVLKWTDEEKRRNLVKLRLVCLLHDIGHGPFSHAGDNKLFRKIENEKKELRALRHEDYSANIIRREGTIKDVIDTSIKPEYGISAEEIAQFIEGKNPAPIILQLMVNGPLDADKMDYLWRDSHYTGVHYGKFDIDRLVQTLVVVEDQQQKTASLGIDEDGVPSAEGLILARYYMFLQVYFHDIRRAYDFHLTDYLENKLEEGTYPVDLAKYLELDDHFVLNEMRLDSAKNNELAQYARVVLERKHYKPVQEVRITGSPSAGHETRKFNDNFKELCEKFDGVKFRKDDANDSPNKFASYDLDFLVRKENVTGKDKYSFISYETGLINSLTDFNILRIYVPKNSDFNKIVDYIKKEQKWK